MNIYFAGSIRGGREFQKFYVEIISHLKNYGKVMTEHIGNLDLDASGETDLTDEEIYVRDKNWIMISDVIIAEVSSPSLGVGYELGLAESLEKRVICLYYDGNQNTLSAMVAGNDSFRIERYSNSDDLKAILDNFLQTNINHEAREDHEV
jgi:nucleoside 2-deoxyribosyltransferase